MSRRTASAIATQGLPPGSMSRPALSERIVDSVCLAFALFTLCCHAVVAAGGTLTSLIATCAVAGLAVLGLALARRHRTDAKPSGAPPDAPPDGARRFGDDGTHPQAEASLALGTLERFYSMLAFVLPVAGAWVALSLSSSQDKIPLWWGWLAVMSGAAFLVWRPLPWSKPSLAPAAPPPARSTGLEVGLFALSLLCVVLALVAHRPDADDGFYLNLAVGAVDRWSWPLLSGDTLHGIEGISAHLPVYRLHSYELLNALFARLSGLPAIVGFHFVSASVAAALVPLSFAALWRQLTPRQWLWGVAATLVVLVAAGETHRSYGNFALVRIWQGKAIALYVFLPLVQAYAIRFALEPRRWNALLLAASQIAALGCSSSLVWVAPASAAIAMASVLPWRARSLKTLAFGLSTSAYLMVAGLAVKAGMSSVPAMARPFDPALQLSKAFELTLGSGPLLIFSLVATLCAWVCWPAGGIARRYAVAFPLAVGALLLNPYTADFVHRNLTGPSFWRVMWVLPVPVLLALVLTAPLRVGRTGSTKRALGSGAFCSVAGPTICITVLVGFAIWIPKYSTLSPKNRVTLTAPQLKVDWDAYEIARTLSESVEARAQVVAPHRIARWIPTFHHHPYPLLVGAYLNHAESQLGPGELDLRRSMTSLVSGQAPDPAAALEEFDRGLTRFDVAGVCLRKSRQTRSLRERLQDRGFERTLERDAFEIWLRR